MAESQVEPHVQRMQEESNELDNRCYKLSQFIDTSPAYKTLPERKQELMRLQLQAMQFYATVLDMRLKLER